MSADLSPPERRAALAELRRRAEGCTRCPELVRGRRRVVFGSGPYNTPLMVVGEAPGRTEEDAGVPMAGASGALLDELLASIGFTRDTAAVVTLVRCRPPDNRVPLRTEVDHCGDYLAEQVALVRPVVVLALGGLATRTLRGAPDPVARVRGTAEIRVIGGRAVRLLPVLHPAAALYTDDGVAQLRADIAQVPDLIALGPPPQPEPEPAAVAVPPDPEPAGAPEPAPADDGQLELF